MNTYDPKYHDNKRALITGILGQDGFYLTKKLLEHGYQVFGTTRNLCNIKSSNIAKFNYLDRVKIIQLNPLIYTEVLDQIERIRPSEVYNLSGQSSVGYSFQSPRETIESHVISCLNLLECIRTMGEEIRFYNAGSAEVFGDPNGIPISETTPHDPISPYGLAKSQSAKLVEYYRNYYGLYACTGYLFNHESPLRSDTYVTQKIIQAARDIASGSRDRLILGNINIVRDWGYAAEYVEAKRRLLSLSTPEDFIIATGRSHSLKEFIDIVFSSYGLDWNAHIDIDPGLYREADILENAADVRKAQSLLKWKAKVQIDELIRIMINEQY